MFSWFKKNSNPVALKGQDHVFNVKIASITQTSPDTKIFRFELPDPNSELGLPVCQHIRIVTDIDGKKIFHSYTPIKVDTKGFFECVIKIYPEGRITQFLDKKVVGDSVKIYGPVGKLKYEKPNFLSAISGDVVSSDPKSVAMIAGGSGITPMYQIMQYITDNNLSIKCNLLYSNKTVSDILIREELTKMAENNSMSVTHTLTRHEGDAPQGMKVGRVNADMMKAVFDAPDLIFICGPQPFNKTVKEAAAEVFSGVAVHVM